MREHIETPTELPEYFGHKATIPVSPRLKMIPARVELAFPKSAPVRNTTQEQEVAEMYARKQAEPGA